MVNKICKDIKDIFLSNDKASDRVLFEKLRELCIYFWQNPVTPESLEELFKLERSMVYAKGSHKQYVEKEILGILTRIPRGYAPGQKENTYLPLNQELIEETTNTLEKQRHLMALKLIKFAFEIFHYKIPRDSYSGKRKSIAIDIILNISIYYDFPEAIELCILGLKSKKRWAISSALEFLETYHRNRDIPLSADIKKILNNIIDHTKDRGVAVGALDVQVKTGEISEFQALATIDDWKEKHDVW